MKLDSIPEVRLENINAGLKSFFTRHGLPVVQITGNRAKRLLRAFHKANATASLRGRAAPPESNLTLVWNRVGGGSDNNFRAYNEISFWAARKDLAEKELDAESLAVVRQAGWFKLRVWIGGGQKYFLFRIKK
jgi:hypothetical protein